MVFPSVSGCFYLDSCVIFAEILNEFATRMNKITSDVSTYNIRCYVSGSVQTECEEKLDKTEDFVGDTFQKMTEAFLEGPTIQRKNLSSPPAYEDIRVLEEMFILLNKNLKRLDVLQGPFHAIEEWIVQFLENEISRPTGIGLDAFVNKMIGVFLMKMAKIRSAYEQLVVNEQSYVRKSNKVPDNKVMSSLRDVGIHSPDSEHIATVAKHKEDNIVESLFVTFDYSSIIQLRYAIRNVTGIVCCDPIYGIDHLR